MNKVQIHVYVPSDMHRRMSILTGSKRPYMSISELVRYAVEKEIEQYDDDDMEAYEAIHRVYDHAPGYDDV